jgi:hypothetical protein
MVKPVRLLLVPISLAACLTFAIPVVAGAATHAPKEHSLGKLIKTRNGMALDLPGQLDAFGFAHYRSIYGGLVVSDNGAHMTVHLTRLESSAEATFRSRAPAGTLSFAATPHSQGYLFRIQSKVLGDTSSLASEGIRIIEFWPSVQTGMEMIGVENLTPHATALLGARLGRGNIRVFNVARDQLPVLTASRTDDSSPFNGGDSITDHSGGCTSGFGITISGTSYLLTAGHCFPVGDHIYNAICNASSCTSGGNASMGTIKERSWANNAGDSEVINTRGSDLIWTGAIGSPERADVAGWTTNPVGDQVCQSGSYSGETCDLVINNNNECVQFEVYVCHLIHAYSPSHAIANQLGDSGGPVFRFLSDGLNATGTDTGSTTADTVACKYNVFSGEKCFWDIYYTAIDWTLPHWGASINTG